MSKVWIVLLAFFLPIAVVAQSIDEYLHNIVTLLKTDNYKKALDEVSALNQQYPTFQAGWVIRGDILRVLSGELTPESRSALASQQSEANIKGYRNEILTRLYQLTEPLPADKMPLSMLRLPEDQAFYLLADLSTSKILMLPNPARSSTKQAPRTFYMSQGANGAFKEREGDNKTPVGIYRLQNFLPPEKLEDFYGAGAYPLDYPNGWDKLKGRTGSGIWIHGVPSALYSRQPQSTNGCLALSNVDLKTLRSLLGDRPHQVHLVVTPKIDWVSESEWEHSRKGLTEALEQWRKSWSAREGTGYLSFYANEFTSGEGWDINKWADHKLRIMRAQSHIQVSIGSLTMFRYPHENHLYWVKFRQNYASSTLTQTSEKEQFWRESNGRWQIVYEGTIK